MLLYCPRPRVQVVALVVGQLKLVDQCTSLVIGQVDSDLVDRLLGIDWKTDVLPLIVTGEFKGDPFPVGQSGLAIRCEVHLAFLRVVLSCSET